MAMTKKEQAEMEELRRQRDEAVQALSVWLDQQTPSAFFSREFICDAQPPRLVTRYFQGHKITASHLGFHIDVLLRDDCVDISYCSDKGTFVPVMMVPVAHQKIELRPVKEEA